MTLNTLFRRHEEHTHSEIGGGQEDKVTMLSWTKQSRGFADFGGVTLTSPCCASTLRLVLENISPLHVSVGWGGGGLAPSWL